MKREDNEQSKDKNSGNSGSKNSELNHTLLGPPSLVINNNARSVMTSAQETAFLEAEDDNGSVETGSCEENAENESEVFLNQ